MKLELKNKHRKDGEVTEHEDYKNNHIYLIRGKNHKELGFKSVTSFISELTEHFNPNNILDIWERNNDIRLKSKSRQEWIQEWEDKGKQASAEGTLLHKNIELWFNNETSEIYSEDFTTFLKFIKNKELDFEAYRTEMSVYSDELELVGNIDFIGKTSKGEYIILDWKRCKEIESKNYGKYMFYPLSFVPDSSKSKYALQLSIYKYILEKEYGMKIFKLYNVRIYNGEYQIIEQEYMKEAVELLFNN